MNNRLLFPLFAIRFNSSLCPCLVGSDQVNFQLEPLLTRDQPSSFYAQMTLIQREPLELARRTWVLDPVHIFAAC